MSKTVKRITEYDEEVPTSLEVAELVATIIKQIKIAQKEMKEAVDNHGMKMTEHQNALMGSLEQKSAELTEIAGAHMVAKDLASFREFAERTFEEIRQSIPELPPEIDLTGIWEALKALQSKVPEEIEADVIINKLEAVEDNDDKLSIDAVKDLREELRKIKKSAQDVMWVAGTGGSSTSSATPLTPTGTVNSVNTVFTVTAEPKYVISDGITYFANLGYTYAALTITMDIPPSQYIRYFT